MIVRSALCIGFLAAMGHGAASQDSASSESATITLTLPSNIPSETVQINYFMAGSFGGSGNFVRPEKGKSAYDIVASTGGKPADNIKIIAYLPGCEIVMLDIPLRRPTPPQLLTCRILKKVWMRGKISPASVSQGHQPAEVEVSYLAMWDHPFFGIADGPVTTIQVATAVPDGQGQFETSVPDFSGQTNLGEGYFEVILRNTTTGNIISSLKPTGDGANSLFVRVLPSYPSVIEFFAKEQ